MCISKWAQAPWLYADGAIHASDGALIATLLYQGGDDGLPDEEADEVGFLMGASPEMRDALDAVRSVFDRLASGESFNAICEQTGITQTVCAALAKSRGLQ